MSTAPTAVVCSELTFAWPDGDTVLDDFSAVLGTGRTGLIGVNGSGKSTLLRLIAGELAPADGTIAVHGSLQYLPQDVSLAGDTTVECALGLRDIRVALKAIEAGDASEENFDVVGDDWDVDERARATLDLLGLTEVGLDRRIGELSGGESVLLCLAARLVASPDVLLLDEPTNNLDRDARARLYEAVRTWRGTMVIVSHDRELLQLVDQICDLRDGELLRYGGNFADYETAVAHEQDAAQRLVRVAEQDLRRQKRELGDARIKLDRRQRYGQKMYDTLREPRAVMKERKRQAQVSAGKHRTMHLEKLEDAKHRVAETEEALRDDAEIRVDLPETDVPAGRTVLTLSGLRTRCQQPTDLVVRGPERIALVGGNGAGKSTLLDTVAGRLAPLGGTVDTAVASRYLPQRLDILDPDASVVANVARFAPSTSDNDIRARLARFLLKGRRADQLVSTLSGGERFRATLAALLLAEPPPHLLLLDEPTNNLDLASVRELGVSLEAYRGALIVASHDLPFLRELGITRWLRLEDGVLGESDPL